MEWKSACFSGRQVLTPAYSLGSPHKKPAGPCFCGSRGWERREHWGPGGWWECRLPGAQGGGGLSRSESLGSGTNWGGPQDFLSTGQAGGVPRSQWLWGS